MRKITPLLKSISISMMLLIMLPFSISTSFAQTSFSGTWKLDEKKSILGDLQFRIASDKIVIEQGKSDLTMRRTGQGPGGATETNEKFTFDGKECQNKFFGDNQKTSTVSWTNKDVMNIKSKASFKNQDGDVMVIDIDENYSLGDDGKTLTINYASVSNFGEIKQTQVYSK